MGTVLYKKKELDTVFEKTVFKFKTHKRIPELLVIFHNKLTIYTVCPKLTIYTVLTFEDKYLLGQGMFEYLCKKLDSSGNFQFVTYCQGYHDIHDFGRYMLVCWRFYTTRWIFKKQAGQSGNSVVKSLDNRTYKLKRGEKRGHNDEMDIIVSKKKRQNKKHITILFDLSIFILDKLPVQLKCL